MKKEIIIKKIHSKDCCINKTNREYYCPTGFFFGNYIGNKSHGSHYWLEMRCNDTSCESIVVISIDKINSLIAHNTQ